MTSVRLVLPEGEIRLWHKNLHDALLRDGTDVSVDWRAGARRPLAVTLLDELERLLLARNRASTLEVVGPWKGLRRSSEPTDLVFDLTGGTTPATGSIFPGFCGGVGELACDAMLLAGETPRLDLIKIVGENAITIATALPALEQPNVLRCGREAIASRLATLIRAVVRKGAATGDIFVPLTPPQAGPVATATFMVGSLAARARAQLMRLVAHEGHWRVGWRRLASEGDSVQSRLDWTATEWRWLDDDRRRYYADPFLFDKDGVVHVFCEEYPYATGKAVICWFPLDANGAPVHAPRVVLERPHHLSYPLVFRHGDYIWMMPESSNARALELYRADPFPEKWTLDRVLIDDVDLADATWFEHEGRYWMTAATSEEGGSSWDCLATFVGASPLGPWRRCGEGPALVDASAARPAGHLFRRDGGLWRPAQDCTRGYGSGLALCRVDRLEESAFQQTVQRRLGPPPGVSAEGVHTFNAAAGFETIDVIGLRRKRFF
jgi:hypothetical protein